MAYYDRIAREWQRITGHEGGSFKKHVLNDVLLQKIPGLSARTILELGAGNGYFLRLALDRFPDAVPGRIIITDASRKLLKLAETNFKIPDALYARLDVRSQFPYDDQAFDLILATMVFNEITNGGLKRALGECRRVLRDDGLLLITVTHPAFINSLNRRQLIRRSRRGMLTMPGPEHLRLPIVLRQVSDYERLLAAVGYTWDATDVYATERVVRDKPGLRHAARLPLALVLACHPSVISR